MLRTIFYSYMIALLPLMSQSFLTSREALKRQCDASIKYLAVITVPVSTGLALLAPRLVTLIYGHDFDAAVPVLQVLAWTVCVFSIALVFGRVLAASHCEVLDLYCNIAALGINAVLGWYLIAGYGPRGAAIAAVVSLAAFGILEGVLVTRRLFKVDVFAPLARAACGSAVMALLLRPLDHLPIVVLLPLGAVAYLGALICLGTFSRGELHAARELVTGLVNSLPPWASREASTPVKS